MKKIVESDERVMLENRDVNWVKEIQRLRNEERVGELLKGG